MAEVWGAAEAIHRRVFAGEAAILVDHPWTLIRDGSPEETFFTTYFSPVRDESGAVAGNLSTGFETTQAVRQRAERSPAETALRESEARLQAANNLVGLALYTWDLVIGALEWDERLKAMWGLPAEAHINVDVWMSAIHPEDRPRVQAAVAQCIDPDGDGIYHIEYRVIGINDRVERWDSTHGQTFFDNRQPVRFIGAAMDVT